MKKILNFFKALLYSFWPALAGLCIVMDVRYIIKNIQAINTGSGWSVVWSFVMAAIEVFLVIVLLYELGLHQINSRNWIAYKKELDAQTIDSSSEDSETSDETADTSFRFKS